MSRAATAAISGLGKLISKLPKKVVVDVAQHPDVAARLSTGAKFQRAVPKGGGLYDVFFRGSRDPLTIDVLTGAQGEAADFARTAIAGGQNPFTRGFVTRLREATRRGYQEHPFGFAAGAGLTASAFGHLGASTYADISQAGFGPEDPESFAVQELLRQPQRNLADILKVRRMQKAMAENEALLAHLRPDLYQKLAWGEDLPDGAVTFGGQPARDIITAVASAMSDGSLSSPDQSELDLLRSLGIRTSLTERMGAKGNLTRTLSVSQSPHRKGLGLRV